MNDRVEPTAPSVNGVDKPNGIHPPDSPVDVLAHHEIQEPESNVRNEPLKPVAVTDSVKDASVVPQVDSMDEPNTLSTEPPLEPVVPSETNANDSEHAPTPSPTVVNGSGPNGTDVVMGDNDEHTPATTPAVSTSPTMESVGSSTSHTTPNDGPDDDHDKPPPAKRARVYSDADKASLAHSASPPPQSATTSTVTTPVPATADNATPPPPSTADQSEFPMSVEQPTTTTTTATNGPVSSTLSVSQWRFCQSTVRTLKKLKDAGPFLRPVDPVALNIPHYFSIVKIPMDFSTVERKLAASNPAKPDPNLANPRYSNADDFIADVRLIFLNCTTFNGPDHVVTAMGKRVEEVFDKQIKNLPPAESLKPPVVKKQSPPPRPVAVPPPPPPAKKIPPNRRASTSVPVIRRSDAQTDAVGRPKREIHPPAPKDLAYADPPKKPRKSKIPRDDGTVEQLKYCSKILDSLFKKQYNAVAGPFYEPVDWVKLEIPSYPRVIKKPMDMGTMKRKLDSNEYPSASKFYDDFKLMIRNCFTFNPAGTPVNQAGQELQRIFDEKFKGLPPLHPASDDEEEEEEEETSQDERDRTIANLEQQIETIHRNISMLKGKKKEKKKKEKKEKPLPMPSTSKAPPKPPKAAPSGKKKDKKVSDNDVLSFEQKKELSEAIATLEGTKLEKVIQIIHEGVPEIRDSTEEIELEIDTLPAPVLTKLYNFVIRPMKPPPPKRNRPGKGTGTGGLKRKSMDEDVEAEKIRQLEQRMALFEKTTPGGSAPLPHRDGQSSDSSSDSDSSGSDSE
ncbi:transcription initiation at TATA-containing promoter protein [Marasmius tenuissimus]|uniref:Transcription initiation at TATA-containing promoter protein n=1 Tax=Marasmius tenuissimus TaxID=585030 RepID=A0ABR3AE21_9AGAR